MKLKKDTLSSTVKLFIIRQWNVPLVLICWLPNQHLSHFDELFYMTSDDLTSVRRSLTFNLDKSFIRNQINNDFESKLVP